ncbi:glutamine synthetase family protein [Rhodobacteraceae bacterium N5(2021)]|uniref:Glutamine synthetase family protein n=1 Tax=Gymnodinialimonas phycosphaerae TaxID=2841589 RepID=A0A975TVM2_9RHOB|nr:glutamine synthetase family protein [Gymnodinialimonas phycosphaerae]MBY4891307.1 glutamine synthetase family protein [Gymnodinialimonas phycosphaerae]
MTPSDISAFVTAEGIETIRTVFTDPHGILRGKTITASALQGALKNGIRVPSTLLLKDMSHRTVFPVWAEGGAPMQGASDVLLRPDPVSFKRWPHAPHSALIHCDVTTLDGAPIPFASRTLLQSCEEALAEEGLAATFGLEIEFQIFRVLDPQMAPRDATMPGTPPQVENTTQGTQYLTETRYAEVEPMLDRLRRAAQEMGMDVRSVEIEMGPSQYEFTFAPAGPGVTAEMAVNFRTLAKEICARYGLLASFMAKPALPNAAANGWHIHQSLCDRTGINLFTPKTNELSDMAAHWIAGLLIHADACCLLTNPTVNSYKRFVPHQLAPNHIGWAHDNRGAMVRAITAAGDPASRVENRLPDSSANPYFAFAAQLLSGLDGLRAGRTLPPPMTTPYGDTGQHLPSTLGAAIDAFAASDMLRTALTPVVARWLVTLKRAEWERYLAHISDWEQAEYFATL